MKFRCFNKRKRKDLKNYNYINDITFFFYKFKIVKKILFLNFVILFLIGKVPHIKNIIVLLYFYSIKICC